MWSRAGTIFLTSRMFTAYLFRRTPPWPTCCSKLLPGSPFTATKWPSSSFESRRLATKHADSFTLTFHKLPRYVERRLLLSLASGLRLALPFDTNFVPANSPEHRLPDQKDNSDESNSRPLSKPVFRPNPLRYSHL